VVIIVMAALLGGLLTALLLAGHARPDGFTADRPEVTRLPRETFPAPRTQAPPTSQPTTPTPRTASRPGTTDQPVRPNAAPRSVRIPILHLEMPVIRRGVDDNGAMAMPTSAFTLAWYRFGSRPRDPSGATMLAGHVDTVEEGAGPLAGLGALRRGDRIEVTAGSSIVTYRTTSVTRISKALIDLPAVFSRVGPPRLHLVTCGGEYLPDEGGYQDNVVVSARRVTVSR
jgi:sortase (surface protein transpeptidase)